MNTQSMTWAIRRSLQRDGRSLSAFPRRSKLVGHRVVGACEHDGVTDESIEVVGRGARRLRGSAAMTDHVEPDDPALLLCKPIAMAS